MGRFTATATTTTTTGYPAAVERVLRPRPERNGTMVVCGLACPSPQSSATTRPWFFLGLALLDRIPYYRQTHSDYTYAQTVRLRLLGEVLETCRVPSSSLWRPLFERPTHRRRIPSARKQKQNEGGMLARTPPHLRSGVPVAAGIRLVQATQEVKSNCHRMGLLVGATRLVYLP